MIIGPVVTFLLALIPIALWFPFASFTRSQAIWLSLGQFTALAGYSLYCLNFVLSARFKFLEKFFSGLNRMYIFHHLLGATAFILLLFHPLTIAISYLHLSLSAAVGLFIPTLANLPVTFGLLSLGLTIILLIITLFLKLEYDLWKTTHKFLSLALFLAALHVFLVGSTLSASPPLKYYLFALTLAAAASFLYRKFLLRLHPYIVSEIKPLNPDIIEIILTPAPGHPPLSSLPGQFIFIRPAGLNIPPQSHPFSLTQAPSFPHLSLAVKTLGGFTQSLRLLTPGLPVSLEGPFGQFGSTLFPTRHQIWIAGGIGITPFVSLARALGPSSPHPVDLFYCVTSPPEAVFTHELNSLSQTLAPLFRFHLYPTQEKGRLTAAILHRLFPDLSSCEIFICGPLPMMTSLQHQLISLGLKPRSIHTEQFALYG